MKYLLKAELGSENKLNFKWYPLAIPPLIYSIFHFHCFTRGESPSIVNFFLKVIIYSRKLNNLGDPFQNFSKKQLSP